MCSSLADVTMKTGLSSNKFIPTSSCTSYVIIAETIESQYVLKLTEARISRIAEARFLLNFPGQLSGCCSFVCHFFVFIFGLLNDSILNFALLFERTLFPAYVTTLARDLTREQPLPSFHPILHLYLYLCCLTRADSFKVGVLCRGSTADKRLRRCFACISVALLVL